MGLSLLLNNNVTNIYGYINISFLIYLLNVNLLNQKKSTTNFNTYQDFFKELAKNELSIT